MKISYNSLKELLPDLQLDALGIADLLTKHGYATVVEPKVTLDPHIRVVKILKIEPHPNADRLRLATVTDGSQEIQVVCGAPNIVEGQLVPYSPPGAQVFDKEGQLFTLTEVEIRGVKSPGMLNSSRELGLDNDHNGIFVLPADTPLGSLLSDHIPSNTLLEVDIEVEQAQDAIIKVLQEELNTQIR